MSLAGWFVFFLFVVVTIPVFIGVVAFTNRATGEDTDDEIAELKQRVDELEAREE